jgi:hypothetical protein
LSKSWQKVSKEHCKICKLAKCLDKIATAENSEMVRRRRAGGRRFVVPRPGATLSAFCKVLFTPKVVELIALNQNHNDFRNWLIGS